MRALKVGWFVLTVLVLVPAAAFAQASITGVVRDSSGAVLPGVTVEAASPALIEKTRSAVSDGSGLDRNGIANAPTMTFFTARGGSTNEGRMTINGMVVAASFNGGGVSSLAYDANNVDEVGVVVAGGMGDTDVGGPVMNLVPRTGGNS